MANPSSHGERHHRSDRERERERSHHHHHRTISSTTLLLVLSLVLAVLAVMLSLPSGISNRAATPDAADPAASGSWSVLTPKRTQALLARESAVAVREAEVARREAELLIGAPVSHTIETVTAPAATIIKEIVKEDSLTPPGWAGARTEDLVDRELKVTEREREISRREESVNRREHDASRRESWIMEQLIALGNDGGQVEEEYVYEPPAGPPKRKAKFQELPPLVISETSYETETKTVVETQFVTVPAPANTRRAASPTPVVIPSPTSSSSPKTTAVEIVTEEIPAEEEEEELPMRTVTVKRGGPGVRRAPPKRWFPGW
ncbi:hypothetical protein ONZ45_g1704 [Pleurotus djamor]|nr:hypothetical protein ONZ45_g1704 [Pleurotus djamor]